MSDYAEHPLPAARREPRDISFIVVAGAFGALLLTLGLLGGLCVWLFPSALRDQERVKPVPSFPRPMLQASPPVDESVFLQQQDKAVNGTYWIDREAGIVHVPITDAMRTLAARGIKDWPTAAPTDVQR